MPPVVRFVTVGSLKEPYLREAVAEYRKRLSGLCRIEELELKEARLPDRPSEAEIRQRRLHFGLVFQNFNLFPHFSVL